MTKSVSAKFVSRVVWAFFSKLQSLGEYEYDVGVITFEYTNAEGNVTHSRYPKEMEIAKMALFKQLGFLSSEYCLIPVFSSVRYKKDFYFGDRMKVILKVIDEDPEEFVLQAEFVEVDSKEVRATAKQTIRFDLEFPDPPQSQYAIASGVFPHKMTVDPTMVAINGQMHQHEYFRLFSDAREVFGLFGIRGFKEEAGKKYLLKTYQTEVHFFGFANMDDNLNLRVAPESKDKASFWLRGELMRGAEIVAVMRQRIVYTNIAGKPIRLDGNVKTGVDACFQLFSV
jgi:acyl-CoA thioesterase FadM